MTMSTDTDLIEAHERRIGEQAQMVAELKRTVADLETRVAELEQVVDTGRGAVEYENMTRKDKVRAVRSHLYTMATERGRKSLKYQAVVDLFGGRPSVGHAYDLMGHAGNADGFSYGENRGGEKRLRVDPADVNAEADFHEANKAMAATAD